MIAWCFALTLSFLHKKLYFIISNFVLMPTPFTDLRKLSTLIQPELFQFLSRFCPYLWNTHNSKNISEVIGSRTSKGCKKHFLNTGFCLFVKWRYFPDISIKYSLAMKICVVVNLFISILLWFAYLQLTPVNSNLQGTRKISST